MHRPVHFEFYSRDPEASSNFFVEALGWEINQWGDQPYWLATTGEGPGIDGAIAPLPDESLSPHTMNTIDVPDLEAAIEACTKAGGSARSDIMDIPGVGRWIQIEEPGGNVFGLMEPAVAE